MITETITNVLSKFIAWFGTVVDALVTSDGALHELLPLFCLGIGISVFMVIMKAIRKVTWGA